MRTPVPYAGDDGDASICTSWTMTRPPTMHDDILHMHHIHSPCIDSTVEAPAYTHDA